MNDQKDAPAGDEAGAGLVIPDVRGMDLLSAALKYARCGWYVLPVRLGEGHGGKHPGSYVGKRWPEKSSRDARQITAWFAGVNTENIGIALHVGRSGAVALDIDDPDAVPEAWREAVDAGARQATRTEGARGHRVFRMPAGRSIGNGGGGAWGEVRGKNGVIIVEPTRHTKATVGGVYRWADESLGCAVPELPAVIAGSLPDSKSADDAASDAEIERALNAWTGPGGVGDGGASGEGRVELAQAVVRAMKLEPGSRHESAVNAACWLLREARAGLYDARYGLGLAYAAFRESVADEPTRNVAAEWRGIVAWAVAQAEQDDARATWERVADPYGVTVDGERGDGLREPGDGGDAGGRGGTPVDALLAEMLTADQVAARPSPVPLVSGLLDMKTCAWMIGKPGSYKSFVAMDIAAHVARGEPWLGRRVRKGPVVFIVGEGVEGTTLRVRAWKARYGEMPDVYFLPRPVQAKGPEWPVLIDACVKLGAVMVVLDTQARVTVGIEENSNTEMGGFVEQLRRMKEATGACVLTVHHIGRNGEDARGASAIDGAQDTEIKVIKGKGLSATVMLDKQKDMPDGEDAGIEIKLESVPMGHDPETGRELSSLVIMSDTFEAVKKKYDTDFIDNLPMNQSDIMRVLIDVFGVTGGTQANIRAAVQERRKSAGRPDMPKQSFFKAWGVMIERGLIESAGGMRWAYGGATVEQSGL